MIAFVTSLVLAAAPGTTAAATAPDFDVVAAARFADSRSAASTGSTRTRSPT